MNDLAVLLDEPPHIRVQNWSRIETRPADAMKQEVDVEQSAQDIDACSGDRGGEEDQGAWLAVGLPCLRTKSPPGSGSS
jgi:hypothetical protein